MTLSHRLHGAHGEPLLVLSNSLGTSQELWVPQLPRLAERFRVLTYDHPGHGTSPVPESPCTVESLADSLLALLDDLRVERVSVCGVSLGGMVATALALRAPERVERLVVACTSAHLAPAAQWRERARVVRAEGMEATADAVIARWFTPRFAVEHAETVARFRRTLAAVHTEGYARCCEALAAWDARTSISAISAPTLVVAGSEDPATPLGHAELLASSIDGARLVVLEGAAHLANVERPEAFADAVLEHLEQEVFA